jgi:hypothetical protein
MLDAISWVTLSQMMAVQVTADTYPPALDHGEMEDNPIPVPSARRISDNAEETNAPAITADQVTPDE